MTYRKHKHVPYGFLISRWVCLWTIGWIIVSPNDVRFEWSQFLSPKILGAFSLFRGSFSPAIPIFHHTCSSGELPVVFHRNKSISAGKNFVYTHRVNKEVDSAERVREKVREGRVNEPAGSWKWKAGSQPSLATAPSLPSSSMHASFFPREFVKRNKYTQVAWLSQSQEIGLFKWNSV